MGFKKKVALPTREGDFKYKVINCDADSLVYKVLMITQESYIRVRPKGSNGKWGEFKNKTAFYGAKKKEEGGWLGKKNEKLIEKGKEPLSREDFDLETLYNITPFQEAITSKVKDNEGVVSTKVVEEAKGFKSEDDALKHAIWCFDCKVGSLLKYGDAASYLLYIGGEGNYRKQIARVQKYKGTRPPKPILFNRFIEAIKEKYAKHIVVCDKEEAEDTVGIRMAKVRAKWEETGVWEESFSAIDKDTWFIRAPILNYDKPLEGYTLWTEDQCYKHFLYQCLIGDTTDDIPKLPDVSSETRSLYNLGKRKGFGGKSAEAILEGSKDIKEMFERVFHTYRTAFEEHNFKFNDWETGEDLNYTWKDYLTEISILLRMRQKEDEIYNIFEEAKQFGVEV